MSPCQWYLHNNASYPYRLQWCTSIPSRTDVCFCTCRWWKSGWSQKCSPKTSSHMDSDHSRHFHFLLDHLRWAQARDPHRTDVKLSPCVTEIQVAFLDAASDCVRWKWFSKLFLSTSCIWQNSMIVSCLMPSEDSQQRHIQQRSTALPNTDWDFSGFPESFDKIMYGRWWKA